MVLIIGGRYQGKLAFAKAAFELSEDDLFLCDEDTDRIDFSKRCIAYVDRYALNRVRAGASAEAAFSEGCGLRGDAVVIATDISSGVVPTDAVARAWREASGRLNQLLAARADAVWRLFCGIPQQLK